MDEEAVRVRLPYGNPACSHTADFGRNALVDAEGGRFQDVTLVVGPEEDRIACNSYVLASSSRFIARYYEDEKHMKQTKGGRSHSVIPLPGLSGPAVQIITDALATHDFECELDQLEECCKAADFLDIELIKAAFHYAAPRWGALEAAKGTAAHAAFLVKLAQLGDQYHAPALVQHACMTGLTAPAKLIGPHIDDWPPAALMPYLWSGHLDTLERAAKKARKIQNYEKVHAHCKSRTPIYDPSRGINRHDYAGVNDCPE